MSRQFVPSIEKGCLGCRDTIHWIPSNSFFQASLYQIEIYAFLARTASHTMCYKGKATCELYTVYSRVSVFSFLTESLESKNSIDMYFFAATLQTVGSGHNLFLILLESFLIVGNSRELATGRTYDAASIIGSRTTPPCPQRSPLATWGPMSLFALTKHTVLLCVCAVTSLLVIVEWSVLTAATAFTTR